MVERNYRVFCSMNDIPLEEGTEEAEEEAEDDEMDVDESENVGPSAGDEEDEEWDGIMDVDEARGGDTLSFFQALKAASSEMPKTKSKKKKTKLSLLIREKIRKVLEDDTQLADKRAGKLHENDFLRLLSCFNAENIHFA
jgi:18S rRNA (adenine1779-N6/adenine1780-N6)-dimethyltransferase